MLQNSLLRWRTWLHPPLHLSISKPFLFLLPVFIYKLLYSYPPSTSTPISPFKHHIALYLQLCPARPSMEEKGRRLKPAGTMMASSSIVCHATISRMNHRRKIRHGDVGGRTTSVRRKVRELQRLVPGGRRLRAEKLFLRTADYIFQLRLQVHVLKTLSEMYMP